MKKCPECKTLLSDEALSCNVCGYPDMAMEVSVKTKKCPECHNSAAIDDSSCKNCGYPFEAADLGNEDLKKRLEEAEARARLAEEKALNAEKKLEECSKLAVEQEKEESQKVEQNTVQVDARNQSERKDEQMPDDDLQNQKNAPYTININETSNQDLQKANKFSQILKSKKVYAIVGVCIIALVAIFFGVRGTPVKSIAFELNEGTLPANSVSKLEYTIEPSDAKNKEVTWKSSNPKIVSVDKNGNITALKEGTCSITVSSKNNKKDKCEITVTAAKPDLSSIYTLYCSPGYASLASDGSYLTIDTKPYDTYYADEDEALQSIISVNAALNLPGSLIQKMSKTRALDGVQSEQYDQLEVSWSYHPDNGLEILYVVK
jgi:hypothetical protein